ncbi:unnamed protein product [Cuscuta campestris]|uniref:Uncharacterized protein n=1 Tax=Cuscuta campestris TaxID=132261 RepID=A0A484KCH1_9ASTE|nr:unnamed protein product [Cuscuta campestris]
MPWHYWNFQSLRQPRCCFQLLGQTLLLLACHSLSQARRRWCCCGRGLFLGMRKRYLVGWWWLVIAVVFLLFLPETWKATHVSILLRRVDGLYAVSDMC